MRLINTNLLNYFYKNGVKPLKDSLTKKLDASKGANNLLTTEAGFWLDARQGKELKRLIDEQNSNLSDLNNMLITVEASKAYTVAAYGTADIQNISIPVPAGYKAVAVAGFTSGAAGVAVINVYTNRVNVQNVTANNITATAKVIVLCAKVFSKNKNILL